MSLQPPTSTSSLGGTFGALYLGATIAAILFGITNLQVLIYYKKYFNDWVLDALHVALSTHALYFYLIDMFGNATGALETNEWSMNLQLSLNDVIIVYVQGLYAIRLWKRSCRTAFPQVSALLCREKIYEISVVLLLIMGQFLAVAASLGTATFMIYEIYFIGNLISVSTTTVISIYALFSTIVIADFTIAFMMCYYLHKSRGEKHFSSSPSDATSSRIRVSYKCMFSARSYRVYVNSLLAMFNYRRKHSSKTPTQESVGPWAPAVLQIKRRSSGNHNMEESNIGIPLSEIQDAHPPEDKRGNLKPTLDCQV
ncbi:hypothetical protein IW262DRAFT_1459539 [Armillaria fumosa]|nr:hypothetical protein IW262DRAFT_1459539 [Armillaria fumosa]